MRRLLSGILAFSLPAMAGVNTTSAKLTLFGAWLSEKGDCSSPVEIFASDTGEEKDIAASPTIGSGNIPKGNYKCLILKMSDAVKFKPATNSAPCVAGTEYTIDVCRAVHSQTYKDLVSGASVACTNGASPSDKVYVYISTDSFCEDSLTAGCSNPNAFAPPTAAADKVNGIKLGAVISITADTQGSFVFNTDGKVGDDFGACNMEPPIFSYKAE